VLIGGAKGSISYYQDEKAWLTNSKPKGVIDLQEIDESGPFHEVASEVDPTAGFKFKVRTEKRIYVLKSESKGEMDRWLMALDAAASRYSNSHDCDVFISGIGPYVGELWGYVAPCFQAAGFVVLTSDDMAVSSSGGDRSYEDRIAATHAAVTSASVFIACITPFYANPGGVKTACRKIEVSERQKREAALSASKAAAEKAADATRKGDEKAAKDAEKAAKAAEKAAVKADSKVAPEYIPRGEGAGELLVVCKKSVVRKGFESDTDKVVDDVGTTVDLQVGEEVETLEQRVIEKTGQVRIRFWLTTQRTGGNVRVFERGLEAWTSRASTRGDTLLMPKDEWVAMEAVRIAKEAKAAELKRLSKDKKSRKSRKGQDNRVKTVGFTAEMLAEHPELAEIAKLQDEQTEALARAAAGEAEPKPEAPPAAAQQLELSIPEDEAVVDSEPPPVSPGTPHKLVRQESVPAVHRAPPEVARGENAGKTFMVVKKTRIRMSWELDSDEVGDLEEGEEIESLEMRELETGQTRVRFWIGGCEGWVSLRTAGGSKQSLPLLEEMRPTFPLPLSIEADLRQEVASTENSDALLAQAEWSAAELNASLRNVRKSDASQRQGSDCQVAASLPVVVICDAPTFDKELSSAEWSHLKELPTVSTLDMRGQANVSKHVSDIVQQAKVRLAMGAGGDQAALGKMESSKSLRSMLGGSNHSVNSLFK